MIRQSLGKILARLKKTGRPILVEKDRKPAAVLISLEDYKRRFVDVDADDERRQIVERIRDAHLKTPRGESASSILRRLRER